MNAKISPAVIQTTCAALVSPHDGTIAYQATVLIPDNTPDADSIQVFFGTDADPEYYRTKFGGSSTEIEPIYNVNARFWKVVPFDQGISTLIKGNLTW